MDSVAAVLEEVNGVEGMIYMDSTMMDNGSYSLVVTFDAVLAPGRDADVELVSRDFVRRVEDLIAQYGDSAAAMKELADLIAG